MRPGAHDKSTATPDAVDARLAYRPGELAAMVGLSRKAVYRAIERGELGAAKVAHGSRLLIPAKAAEAWLEENAVHPAVPTRSARRWNVPHDDSAHPLRAALFDLDGDAD